MFAVLYSINFFQSTFPLSYPKMDAKAMVTGASRGIGKAIATQLVLDGYHVILMSRPSPDLERTAVELAQLAPGRVSTEEADLLDEEGCVKSISKHQDLAVLVLCGLYQGPGESQRVDHLSMDEYKRLLQGNVLTQVAMAKAAMPSIQRSPHGALIMLVSQSSRVAPTRPVDKGGFQSFGYTSTKAAVAKLIPILAQECKELHPQVRCFNIDPGLVITDKMRMNGTDKLFKKANPNSPDLTARAISALLSAPKEQIRQFHGAEFVDVTQVADKLLLTHSSL